MEKEREARLEGSGAVARDHIVAAGEGGVAVVVSEDAQVTVTVQGENLREREQAYLDGLLAAHKRWRDRYTPLTNITGMRATIQDGPGPLVAALPVRGCCLGEWFANKSVRKGL